ncbi:Clostridium P-47 protein [Serratia grimesii]|uniref:TULIP family P47-like protein n=1 Tax=Serratia grimesii TaxID=82995 RepID=UPI0021C50116|nr:TULIP family P47-like protein [Serratia grimesii]CAI2793751.1 Clostridium P-47 protein [Serratia grimesii]
MTDVSINGWDVVSITDLDTMNAIINADRLYPSEFSASDSVLGTQIDLNGTWGKWEISNNASGGKINIRCEISTGSVKYSGMNGNINDGDSPSYVEVEVLLKGIQTNPEKWVSGEDNITESTRCHQLMIDTDNVVIVTEHHFTGPDMDRDGLSSVVPELFQEWFNGNVDKFGQIFSVILIGLEAKNSDFQWLYPSSYSYAANSSIDGNTTGFGVLTLIDGRTDTGSLQQSVDIQALNLVKTFGANLALVVSKTMFVEHMLLPAAVSIVKGSTESDFTISDTGLSLTNSREMIWNDFTDKNGKIHTLLLPENGLVLDLQGDAIHLIISGAHFRPDCMCTVFMNVAQSFRFRIGKNADGETVFVPDESGLGHFNLSVSVKPDVWVSWLSIGMAVIEGVSGLLAAGTSAYSALYKSAVSTLSGEEEADLVYFSYSINDWEPDAEDLELLGRLIDEGITTSAPTVFNFVAVASAITEVISGTVIDTVILSDAICRKKYDVYPSFQPFVGSIKRTLVWPQMNNAEPVIALLADCFVIGISLK